MDFVLVGGEDHKSGEADDADKRFERLEQWARGKMPMLKDVTHRWSGQVLDTIDYAGFIGKNPGSEYIYVATGDSGQGLTHGVMGAMLNATLVTGGKSEWAELYAPDRKPLKAAKNWVMENSTALKNLAEYVTPGEISSADELEPGQGAIIREGLKKIAAYRDAKGNIHQHSAACTHLGCHLHWNSFESCWDCPCHGSIFGPEGQVLNAPAISGLTPDFLTVTLAAKCPNGVGPPFNRRLGNLHTLHPPMEASCPSNWPCLIKCVRSQKGCATLPTSYRRQSKGTYSGNPDPPASAFSVRPV